MNRSELAARIDHTLLGPAATRGAVERLCAEAVRFGVASTCVDLRYAATAKKALAGSSVRLCVVVGFPQGMTATSVKAFETREAIAAGAEEIDMVIPVGVLKERDLVELRALRCRSRGEAARGGEGHPRDLSPHRRGEGARGARGGGGRSGLREDVDRVRLGRRDGRRRGPVAPRRRAGDRREGGRGHPRHGDGTRDDCRRCDANRSEPNG